MWWGMHYGRARLPGRLYRVVLTTTRTSLIIKLGGMLNFHKYSSERNPKMATPACNHARLQKTWECRDAALRWTVRSRHMGCGASHQYPPAGEQSASSRQLDELESWIFGCFIPRNDAINYAEVFRKMNIHNHEALRQRIPQLRDWPSVILPEHRTLMEGFMSRDASRGGSNHGGSLFRDSSPGTPVGSFRNRSFPGFGSFRYGGSSSSPKSFRGGIDSPRSFRKSQWLWGLGFAGGGGSMPTEELLAERAAAAARVDQLLSMRRAHAPPPTRLRAASTQTAGDTVLSSAYYQDEVFRTAGPTPPRERPGERRDSPAY